MTTTSRSNATEGKVVGDEVVDNSPIGQTKVETPTIVMAPSPAVKHEGCIIWSFEKND